MPKGTCCVDGCDRPVYVREMCTLHYQRFRANGDPLVTLKRGGARQKKLPAPCAVDGCINMAKSLGWCVMHYTRFRMNGDPLVTSRIIGDLEARWWSKVERRGDDECWPWTDAPSSDGYGVFGVGQKVTRAYTWGYLRFVGPLPTGTDRLDHTCHNLDLACPGGVTCPHRLCVNYLSHLSPATNRQNVLGGRSTLLADEQVAVLYARWKAGERAAALALEVGTHRTNIYKRFRRFERDAAA